MSATVLRIAHESQDELERKLCAVLTKFGYRVEKIDNQITVSELAAQVGRSLASVSRAIHRPSCPAFYAVRGRRKILKLTPNPRLLAYLAKP